MHAIAGSTRKGRCHPDADATLARVDKGKYCLIE